MEYFVSSTALRSGDGSRNHPFRTIGEAAACAVPGDVISVLPGVYREEVDPAVGGTDDRHRITYRSLEKGKAIITGAEKTGRWEHYEGDTYLAHISNGVFGDYNPYTTPVKGDWYFATQPVHTGELYLNGKAMYEVPSLDEVLHPVFYEESWDVPFTKHKWYTCQDGQKDETLIYANFQGADPNKENVEINVRRRCFFPSKEGISYITLSGFVIRQAATQWAPPTAFQDGMVGPHWSKGWIIEDCEISDSRCSGISLGKYLQKGNENKWSTWFFKDGTQTQRDCVCQAQREGWSRETVGSHVVRRCNIHDCGQTGIVGHLGGVFSLIEDNEIHHINNKQDLTGAEIGGIKMHAAIDVTYRRNHIHHCTRGIWLDWEAQGTRVTQNLFHDNTTPEGTRIGTGLSLGEDLFIEVSHGPTLVDNNLLLSDCAARISAQGIAFVHNLICGSFTWVGGGTDNGGKKFPTNRYTPYHVPHGTDVAGFMTILHGDARFYNNIFVQRPIRKDYIAYAEEHDVYGRNEYQFVCGTKPYDDYPDLEMYKETFAGYHGQDGVCRDFYYDHLPVMTSGNLYFNGAQPFNHESGAIVDREHQVHIELLESEQGQMVLRTDLIRALPTGTCPVVSTDTLGMAFEPEQRFEEPDGKPIVFNLDYFDHPRGIEPAAGPFAEIQDEMIVF